MKEHYQSEDIHRAIEHALRYQAFEAGAIERILRAKATPRTLESIRNERAGRELQKALPKSLSGRWSNTASYSREERPCRRRP